MELRNLNEVKLNDESLDLLNDIDEAARQVNEYRPLPDDVVRRILDDLEGERVYSSNAIEGSTLDLRETVMVLKQGIGRFKRKREAMVARNLGDAVKLISEWVASSDNVHTPHRLLQLHRMILKEVNDGQAGCFRTERVMIDGAIRQPPSDTEVPGLVSNMFELLSKEQPVHGVVAAAWVHWAIARIHPFFDGNGRVARLWQDLVLLQSRLTCAIIRPEDRREYLDALAKADENEFNPLIQLVCQRTLATFDKYLSHIGQDEQLDEWVKGLVSEADARSSEHNKLLYTKWRRKMEQLRWEFEVCSARVSEASKDFQIQVRKFDTIDQNHWESLRHRVVEGRLGFFIVDFWKPACHWQYHFFFGWHPWTEQDSDEDRSQPRVCLFISEAEGSIKAVRLNEPDDSLVTLREIFLAGNDQFVRKTVDASSGELKYDRGIAPIDIAKDFISDVILKRMSG